MQHTEVPRKSTAYDLLYLLADLQALSKLVKQLKRNSHQRRREVWLGRLREVSRPLPEMTPTDFTESYKSSLPGAVVSRCKSAMPRAIMLCQKRTILCSTREMSSHNASRLQLPKLPYTSSQRPLKQLFSSTNSILRGEGSLPSASQDPIIHWSLS